MSCGLFELAGVMSWEGKLSEPGSSITLLPALPSLPEGTKTRCPGVLPYPTPTPSLSTGSSWAIAQPLAIQPSALWESGGLWGMGPLLGRLGSTSQPFLVGHSGCHWGRREASRCQASGHKRTQCLFLH